MMNRFYNQMNQKLTEQIINNIVRSNPQAFELMNEMKVSGFTPKEFFYKKANEMGVNPQDILKQIM